MFAYCNNNPVNGHDPSGLFKKQYQERYFDDGIGGADGSAIAWGLIYLLEQSKEGLITLAELLTLTEALIKLDSGNGEYYVYVLVDQNKDIQYVGRTTDPVARRNAHSLNPFRAHLTFEIIGNNLNYLQVRGLEQLLMLYCHTINKGDAQNNQINGISLSNPRLNTYLNAAKSVLGFSWNQLSNEYLCWVGK